MFSRCLPVNLFRPVAVVPGVAVSSEMLLRKQRIGDRESRDHDRAILLAYCECNARFTGLDVQFVPKCWRRCSASGHKLKSAPGTEIAASRTKQPAIISSNECRQLPIATHLVMALPAHSNERTPPAGTQTVIQLENYC
jgi:hypothetical protein